MDALAEALASLGKAQGASGSLPPDAGGHAARLWRHLDELSERDPEAYAAFLERQAVNAGARRGPSRCAAPARRAASAD